LNALPDQFRRHCRQVADLVVCCALHDLSISGLLGWTKPFSKRRDTAGNDCGWALMKEADAPFRLLCTNREWPSGCRACNYLDEVTPLHFRPRRINL
jgi:hypothetical protein